MTAGFCIAYLDCRVAAGGVDAILTIGLQAYGVQTIIPVIEAAGGVITTWTGSDAQEGGAVLAAAILPYTISFGSVAKAV
jgi:fructose-1,6-bisphosphatase/inositol monophosphatase family enzyme